MPEFLNTGERLRAEDALRAEAWAAEARKERELGNQARAERDAALARPALSSELLIEAGEGTGEGSLFISCTECKDHLYFGGEMTTSQINQLATDHYGEKHA